MDWRLESFLGAHLGYTTALTERAGGEVSREAGILLLAGPHPLPLLLNTTWRTDPSVPADEVLRRATAFFGARRRRFELMSVTSHDTDIEDAAHRAGLSGGTPDPIQTLVGTPIPGPPAPDGIELRVIDSPSGIAHIATVNQDASAVYRFPHDFFATIFHRPETVLARDTWAVVAYEGGHPVASAQLFMPGDVAYVGWVAVVPSTMRRGLGRMVTEAVVNEGIARGAKVCTLMASPMGAPLYRKMGFEDVGTLISWRPGKAD